MASGACAAAVDIRFGAIFDCVEAGNADAGIAGIICGAVVVALASGITAYAADTGVGETVGIFAASELGIAFAAWAAAVFGGFHAVHDAVIACVAGVCVEVAAVSAA